jgi:phosphoketolase
MTSNTTNLGASTPLPQFTAEDAMALVRERGVVLVSAKGSATSLVEAIVGQPIKGSWWAHPRGKHIHVTLGFVTESEEVLVCRLVGGKVTLVHRRLWPALARLAHRFAPEQISRVREDHTASGRHVSHAVPFPEWVPQAVMQEARALNEQEALAAFGTWLPLSDVTAGVRRPANHSS